MLALSVKFGRLLIYALCKEVKRFLPGFRISHGADRESLADLILPGSPLILPATFFSQTFSRETFYGSISD